MKGVAISLYDKFDDLAVLVDIIRHNWDSDVFISVCSNHPDAESRAENANIDVDVFQQGAQIRYDDEISGVRGGHNLFYRIYDNIRTACRPVLENESVGHFMHLHADAWPLTESGFDAIIEKMDHHDAAVGFSAQTNIYHDYFPPGAMDDQYLVFNNPAARDVGLMEQESLEFPPMSIHLLLMMACTVRFGWGGLYQYSNGSERIHWDGLPSTEIKNDARPMFYNPDYDQVHVATGDFEGELGKELQAHYLQEHGVTSGENIQEFLDEHHRDKAELFDELNDYLESLNHQLPPGISVETFGRDIRVIREYLNTESVVGRLKLLVTQHQDSVFYPAVKGIFDAVQRATGSDECDNWYNRYPDKSINDLFRDELQKEDFPAEMQSTFKRSFEDEL